MDKNSISRIRQVEKHTSKDSIHRCASLKDKYEACILAHNMGTIFSMCNSELDVYKRCLLKYKK